MAQAIRWSGRLRSGACRRVAEARFPVGAMTRSYLDAYVDAISGLTTTGLTVLQDLERVHLVADATAA